MKSGYIMNDSEWQALVTNVGANFNDLTIKRGFQYFKQERVHSFKISSSELIEAVVQGNDSDDYVVKVNPLELASSRCSCPVPAYCKHMIAVLLNYASLQGRSLHALINATTAANFTPPVKVSNQTSLSEHQKKEASFAHIKEKASQIPVMHVTEWHELFKTIMSSSGFNSPNIQYAKNALTSIYSFMPLLPSMLEQLFRLNAQLYVIKSLILPMQKSEAQSHIYVGYYTQIAADEIHKDILKLLQTELPSTEIKEHWSHLKETLTYLRTEMLKESKNLKYFAESYDQFWLHWISPHLQDKAMYQEELQQLEIALKEIGTVPSKLPYLLAQCQMYFYLHQDEQAWELLKKANESLQLPPVRLLLFLTALSAKEEWARLQDWLIVTGPLLNSHKPEYLNKYTSFWEMLLQHLPQAEEHMWTTMLDMFPYSSQIYTEALLTHGKWQKWIDYQLSTGSEPLDFRVSVLQPIEKNAPELLLPFYHQAVERYILLKNRPSYKSAVKLLKRLAKLYKKQKQTDRWDIFIDSFANRHSRLRALQEELRKGKLIS